MSGRWLLVALLACALVFTGAAFLTVEDPSTGVRIAILAAIVAIAALMVISVGGGRRSGR